MNGCPICKNSREKIFNAKVLHKYDVDFVHCKSCGLIQAKDPYWLEEAYKDPIATLDTGILSRNINLSKTVSCVLYFLFDQKGKYVDIAGGYGIFTRLMRDIGYDFYWNDIYCENIFSKGFETKNTFLPFDAITAFEVFEHVQDPIEFINESLINTGAPTIIFTTQLYKGDPPKPGEWWYYAFESGQHISFYKLDSLKHIASRLEMNLYSNRYIHMLTKKHVSAIGYYVMTSKIMYLISDLIQVFIKSKKLDDQVRLRNNGI